MSNVKELLDEAIYAGNLSKNEEEKLYSWIESLILAKRKADEYEAKAEAFDEIIYAINSSSNPGLNGSSYIDAIDFTSKAEYIVRKCESECESDAKK